MLFGILSVVALAAVVNIGLLLGGAYVVVKSRQHYKDTVKALEAFVTAPSQNEPSDFAKVCDNIAELFANRTGVVVQAALRGAMGGTMKGVNAALEKQAIEENPQLSLAEALPKSLKKNPLALMALQSIMSKVMAGSSGSSGSSGNGHQHAKFQL